MKLELTVAVAHSTERLFLHCFQGDRVKIELGGEFLKRRINQSLGEKPSDRLGVKRESTNLANL